MFCLQHLKQLQLKQPGNLAAPAAAAAAAGAGDTDTCSPLSGTTHSSRTSAACDDGVSGSTAAAALAAAAGSQDRSDDLSTAAGYKAHR
jgi:hypothetical protein